MKDHVAVTRSVYLEGGIEEVIAEIRAFAQGLVNPQIENQSWGDDPNYVVTGWRPMTESELGKARVRRQNELIAAKKRGEQVEIKERKLLAELQEKYGPATESTGLDGHGPGYD